MGHIFTFFFDFGSTGLKLYPQAGQVFISLLSIPSIFTFLAIGIQLYMLIIYDFNHFWVNINIISFTFTPVGPVMICVLTF